ARARAGRQGRVGRGTYRAPVHAHHAHRVGRPGAAGGAGGGEAGAAGRAAHAGTDRHVDLTGRPSGRPGRYRDVGAMRIRSPMTWVTSPSPWVRRRKASLDRWSFAAAGASGSM